MRPLIGAHVSVAGGLYKGIDNALRIGAECIQIFGASPRSWRAKPLGQADADRFKQAAKAANFDLAGVYLHASYLVNLASAKDYNREQSIGSLVDHLKIAELIGARGLVFHLGSSGEEPDKAKAVKKTVDAMKLILKEVPGKAELIMENSAGGGQKLGFKFAEIGHLLKQAGSKRVKVCLDTAHIFEAGGIAEYTAKNVKQLFDEFDQEIGLDNLVALHVNDSKTAFDSHHDRHENLGEGYIGLDGFKNLAKEKRLWNKHWIIETPGFDNLGPDKQNIDILRGLFKK